jgi:hypothetical protein
LRFICTTIIRDRRIRRGRLPAAEVSRHSRSDIAHARTKKIDTQALSSIAIAAQIKTSSDLSKVAPPPLLRAVRNPVS